MVNEALSTKFLSKPPVAITRVNEVPYNQIISLLHKVTNSDFSWTVADEQFVNIENEMCVMTTVTLYVPGYISTSRSLIKLVRYADNHLFALLDAVKNLNMFLEQKEPGKINTSAEFVNAKDDKGMPTETVLFENVTKEGAKDILIDKDGKKCTIETYDPERDKKPVNKPTASVSSAPKKFTPEQIKRLRNIQVEHEIQNAEEFGRYVHSWSAGKLSSKSDITPENADSFLEYMDSLGEIVS